MPEGATVVEIDGRRLSISNLDKVLYPAVGFTKGEVIDYYVRIAPVMLDHVGHRCVTFRRFPNGVEGQSFFEKRCPSHRPEWVPVAIGPGDGGQPWGERSKAAERRASKGTTLEYCVLNEVAALAWSANLAALELHTGMARADDIDTPTMVVFDLDPGPPAGMTECAQVGLEIHDTLDHLGLECFAKTSGSKGLQVYVPVNRPGLTHDAARAFALAVGQLLEKQHPALVLTQMAKEQRKGKVFIDWSQNAVFKTTICAYSLRARPTPTASTPVSWDEVADAAEGEPLSFTAPEVLDRVAELGDLFAPTATLEQELPLTG